MLNVQGLTITPVKAIDIFVPNLSKTFTLTHDEFAEIDNQYFLKLERDMHRLSKVKMMLTTPGQRKSFYDGHAMGIEKTFRNLVDEMIRLRDAKVNEIVPPVATEKKDETEGESESIRKQKKKRVLALRDLDPIVKIEMDGLQEPMSVLGKRINYSRKAAHMQNTCIYMQCTPGNIEYVQKIMSKELDEEAAETRGEERATSQSSFSSIKKIKFDIDNEAIDQAETDNAVRGQHGMDHDTPGHTEIDNESQANRDLELQVGRDAELQIPAAAAPKPRDLRDFFGNSTSRS